MFYYGPKTNVGSSESSVDYGINNEYAIYRGREEYPPNTQNNVHVGHPSKRGSEAEGRRKRRKKRRTSEERLTDPAKKVNMMNACTRFLKYSTGVFTFVVFLAGLGILGLGIYIIGSDYGATKMSEMLGNDLYQVSAYVLIACGSLLVVISMCGCCGAYRESRCMLGFFILLMSVLVIALVVAAVLVFVFRENMSKDVIHSMEDVLTRKYGIDLEKSENRMITDMWDWVQKQLKCCGVTGNVNDTTSWAIYKHSKWYDAFETGKPYVPQSCCTTDGDYNICTGIIAFDGPPSKGPPVVGMENNPYLFTRGCYDELVHYIQSHAVLIGASSIATVITMLFGLGFAASLCRRIDYEYY